MAETFLELDKRLVNFIKAQKIFFVATAPDDLKNEYVNLSPKGYDTLMVLDNKTVVYADYPGSGNETATHLRQNGSLTMMFASFDKMPMILRLYGRGEAVALDSSLGEELKEKMRDKISPYVRQLILLHIEKVKTSCGYGVPLYQYAGDRENLIDWCKKASITGKIKKYMGFLWKGL
ncbi:MAG: pyridoxamine 5'-phosphate oxidase family protein [Deltaproteobacteria bacterium]|nr:pyridoxamine 5'-phosphate oxidase family protein [Deltaproteobacteria bacterium]